MVAEPTWQFNELDAREPSRSRNPPRTVGRGGCARTCDLLGLSTSDVTQILNAIEQGDRPRVAMPSAVPPAGSPRMQFNGWARWAHWARVHDCRVAVRFCGHLGHGSDLFIVSGSPLAVIREQGHSVSPGPKRCARRFTRRLLDRRAQAMDRSAHRADIHEGTSVKIGARRDRDVPNIHSASSATAERHET